MSKRDPIEVLAAVGRFNATLRAPRLERGELSPTYSVRCRVVTEGKKNFHYLILLQCSFNQERGYLWESRKGKAGWNIERVNDIERLRNVFDSKIASLPRAPVITAWIACVDLMPRLQRKRVQEYLANPIALERFRNREGPDAAIPGSDPSVLLEERKQAIAALYRANQSHPPERVSFNMFEEDHGDF